MDDDLKSRLAARRETEQPGQYKTIEQIVKIGKANTKPVSVRLSVDTLKYFEENAKKFNTKTGTVISDVLDDYVRTLKRAEMRNRMEIEVALMGLYRHLADKDSEKFFVNWLINRAGEKKTIICQSRNDYGKEEVKSVFYVKDSTNHEQLVDEIVAQIEEIKGYELEPVSQINGDPDNDPAVFIITPEDLFINLSDDVILAPYNLDLMYDLDYLMGSAAVYLVPVKDWAFIVSLITEYATIKERQLGRKISIYGLVKMVMREYNQILERVNDSQKGSGKKNSAKKIAQMHVYYRMLIRRMTRHEDIPSGYERPTDLDEERLGHA